MTRLHNLIVRPRCAPLFALRAIWPGRRGGVFALLALAGLMLGSCAHNPALEKGATATFDLKGRAGQRGNVGQHLGQIVVVDVCASWSDPCLANARAVSEACDVLCPREDVHMMTVLLDELGAQGLAAYDLLELKQPVWLAGENARAGKSALGPLTTIPRVLVFDREGRLVSEQTGGIAQSTAIIEAVLAVDG